MEAICDYSDGETTLEAFVVTDDAVRGRRGCVLVAHAWDGPNELIRDQARALARHGYVGAALDVYGKGVRGSVDGDNSHLMGPLLADRALLRRRLLAGLEVARRLPEVDPERVVIVGPCFGGLCALDLARAAPDGLVAAVAVHAPLTPPPGERPPITARILVLHGWEDPVAPPPDVIALARELTDAGADWQLHAYGHAMHAFSYPGANQPDRGVLYDARAAARAGRTVAQFLDEVLAADVDRDRAGA